MGHQATIVAPDYEVAGDRAEQDGRAVLEVIRLPSRRVLFDPEDRLIKASALPAALARLALRRWDVIHIHTPFRAHALGLRLAKLIRCPTVETYHTHFEEYVGLYLPLLPSGLLRAFARRTSRRLSHEVDHLIAPSQQMVEVLQGYGTRTARTVLPTGLDLPQFEGGSGMRFRRQHGIDPGRPPWLQSAAWPARRTSASCSKSPGGWSPSFRTCCSSSLARAPTPIASRNWSPALG